MFSTPFELAKWLPARASLAVSFSSERFSLKRTGTPSLSVKVGVCSM